MIQHNQRKFVTVFEMLRDLGKRSPPSVDCPVTELHLIASALTISFLCRSLSEPRNMRTTLYVDISYPSRELPVFSHLTTQSPIHNCPRARTLTLATNKPGILRLVHIDRGRLQPVTCARCCPVIREPPSLQHSVTTIRPLPPPADTTLPGIRKTIAVRAAIVWAIF